MKTCPNCRAANLDSAVVCVSCSTPIGEVPMPGPLQQTPPEIPPDPDAIAAEKDARARRAVRAAIAIGGALVIGLVVLIVVLTRGDGFPDEIGGKPRITSDQAKELEDAIAEQDVQGLQLDMALYGAGDQPQIFVVIVRGTSDALGVAKDSPEFWDAFGKGFASGFASTSGGAVVNAKPLTREKDGVRYYCVGYAGVASGMSDGSMCVFVAEEIGLLVSTTYENPRDTITLAQEAAEAL
jgi:hypothetical protein